MDRLIRARAVLAEMTALGLTVEDLIAAGGTAPAADGPTVAEYVDVDVVASGYKPGTRATYATGWRVLVELHGDRPVATVTAEERVR